MARLRCAGARHAAGCDKVIIGIDAPSVILILIWIGQTDCCCAQAQPATGGPSRSGPSPGPTPPGALPSVALCGPQLQTSGLRVRKKSRFRSLASHTPQFASTLTNEVHRAPPPGPGIPAPSLLPVTTLAVIAAMS